jgi:hypothetical protein
MQRGWMVSSQRWSLPSLSSSPPTTTSLSRVAPPPSSPSSIRLRQGAGGRGWVGRRARRASSRHRCLAACGCGLWGCGVHGAYATPPPPPPLPPLLPRPHPKPTHLTKGSTSSSGPAARNAETTNSLGSKPSSDISRQNWSAMSGRPATCRGRARGGGGRFTVRTVGITCRAMGGNPEGVGGGGEGARVEEVCVCWGGGGHARPPHPSLDGNLVGSVLPACASPSDVIIQIIPFIPRISVLPACSSHQMFPACLLSLPPSSPHPSYLPSLPTPPVNPTPTPCPPPSPTLQQLMAAM